MMDHIEVKLASDDVDAKTGEFAGYGAVFGNLDNGGDMIERGAFKDTLREWEALGKLPPMLLQHGGGFLGGADDMLPVGQWTRMEENSKGLKVEGKLFALGTERGQYIYEGLKSGVLDGLSIGYRAKKFTRGIKPTEPARKLEVLDLVEVSIVTFPMNGKARIGSVKSGDLSDDELKNEIEAALTKRGAGLLSRSEARALVRGGLPALKAMRGAGEGHDPKGLLEALRGAKAAFL